MTARPQALPPRRCRRVPLVFFRPPRLYQFWRFRYLAPRDRLFFADGLLLDRLGRLLPHLLPGLGPPLQLGSRTASRRPPSGTSPRLRYRHHRVRHRRLLPPLRRRRLQPPSPRLRTRSCRTPTERPTHRSRRTLARLTPRRRRRWQLLPTWAAHLLVLTLMSASSPRLRQWTSRPGGWCRHLWTPVRPLQPGPR